MELAAGLVISIDTVTMQQQENKRLPEQIYALKRKGTQATRKATLPGGMTVCRHCVAFGRTAPHTKNDCYFDTHKMTDR